MFTPRPAVSTLAAKAGDCTRKTGCSAWITESLWALLPAVALVVAGCGSSTTRPMPVVTAPITPIVLNPGSTFDPHPFALSPDDSSGIINPANAALAVSKKANPEEGAATSSPPSGIAHWFYLVSGANIPENPTLEKFTPSVLTVSGPPPMGAPDPNGWDTVSVEPINPVSTGRQLWKAVQAPGSTPAAPIFYLRSAMSFKTGVDDAMYPGMLVGFGATGADLDLGYPSQFYYPFTPAIYMNQKAAPTGDQSSFQQWSYNDSAQLTNLFVTPSVLYQSGGLVGMGSESVGTDNQWYAYPDYYVDYVVNRQPNASPPFPPSGSSGEQAAYEYMSNQFMGASSTSTCNDEGTTYDGIRCQYNYVSAIATIDSCAASALNWSTGRPPVTSYQGTPISTTEFQTVAGQLHLECQYVADVQTTFGIYNTILDVIFSTSSSAITPLSGDVGISQQAVLHPVPTQVVEGLLYTMLGATGNPAAGVVANLMETGVNAAVAAPNSTLNVSLETTVGNLYGDLTTQFGVLQDQTSSGETAILEDWGRLKVIGPLTEKTGYNGLAITQEDEDTVEAQALKGYKLSVMQQLMQASGWNLGSYVASLNLSYLNNVPGYDKYTYSTFGPDAGVNLNAGWLGTLPGTGGSEPSETVMTTDIQDNGGNMFELFNGLNGWYGMPNALGMENLTCAEGALVTTLFNATPTDLWVTGTPSKGTVLAEPGVNFVFTGNNGGIETAYTTFELRPYGYLPLYSGNSGDGTHLTVSIYDKGYSSSSSVASFAITPTGVSNIDMQDGYSFSPAGFNQTSSCTVSPTTTGSSGLWVTIVD